MDITISSKLEADYLLIKVSGSVADIKDMKFITRQIYNEITKYNSKKVLLDQTKNKPLKSIIYQTELVDFYSEEFPIEVRKLKLAIVTDIEYKEIADFWETYANNRRYRFKVFYSMDDARKFMSG